LREKKRKKRKEKKRIKHSNIKLYNSLTCAVFSIPGESYITGTKIRSSIVLAAGIHVTHRGRSTALVDIFESKT